MNMMAMPAAACPYCERPLGSWHIHHPVHSCAACQRPLGRLLMTANPRVYRVFSLLGWVKGATALGGALVLLFLLVSHWPISSIALAVAFQLALYAATDVTDGVLGLQTCIDRSGRTVREGGDAKRRAWGKLAFGAANGAVALVGLLVAKGSL